MIIKLAGVFSSVLKDGDKYRTPSRKFFGMFRTAFGKPLREGKGPTFTQGTEIMNKINKAGKTKAEIKPRGLSATFSNKLTLAQAFAHDVKRSERNASRKLNTLLGIPSVSGKDNRLERHLKNHSASYAAGVGGLGTAVVASRVSSFKQKKNEDFQ